MIRAFDTTSSRSLNFHEFQRLHYFLVNVQGSFQQFDKYVGFLLWHKTPCWGCTALYQPQAASSHACQPLHRTSKTQEHTILVC